MRPYDEKNTGNRNGRCPLWSTFASGKLPERTAVTGSSKGVCSLTQESASETANFIQAIQEERETLAGMDLAVDCVSVIYAAYQSAEEGRTILLEVASPNPVK